jgi:hypothetical protein
MRADCGDRFEQDLTFEYESKQRTVNCTDWPAVMRVAKDRALRDIQNGEGRTISDHGPRDKEESTEERNNEYDPDDVIKCCKMKTELPISGQPASNIENNAALT